MQFDDLVRDAQEHARSAPDLVAAVLREAILAGRLPTDRLLRQDELAQRLGVSKIPVREGLRQLEAEGLVTFHPNRGVAVASLSTAESREIVEMRVALESLALRHAVPAIGAPELGAAAALLDELDGEGEARRRSRLNWEFHAALYAPARRPLLLGTIQGLHARIDRYMRLVVAGPEHRARSQREHRALLAACERRDTDAAVTVLAAHVEAAGRRLAEHLGDRPFPGAEP